MLLQNNITHFKPKYANKFKTKEIIVTIIEILNEFVHYNLFIFLSL